jgi:2-oxoglutarate dehydrogenase E1 component
MSYDAMELSHTWNADYIDEQYQRWKSDPAQVSREWQWFFSGFELGTLPGREAAAICDLRQVLQQARVMDLIHRFRDVGHLLACLDPLSACPTDHPLLNLAAFHLSDEDLEGRFYADGLFADERTTLRDIIGALRETYCRAVGVEYMHLQDPGERRWLQERMEPVRNRPDLDRAARLRILLKLTEATIFEHFLHTRYVGQKRFSAEGAEGLVAMLDVLVRYAGAHGCREILLGMSHRGRLNVQVNVFGKPYEDVFCEFEGSYDPDSLVGSGDVKYHKGYMADLVTTVGEPLRMLLVDNPSHLESVDPVVEGLARARQEFGFQAARVAVLPLLIHGDAAFAGQGIVAETLNLSQLEGYHTGGTIHVVVNNQIGFTTLPADARSTRYSTDIAKMLMVPIFHVHGEDPEALAHVIRLAYDYRAHFAKDVVIDLVCYRRYGHNEGDEPYYTQPQMYDRIKDRPPPSHLYAERLQSEGLISADELAAMRLSIEEKLVAAHGAARGLGCLWKETPFYEAWKGIDGSHSWTVVETGVSAERLVALARRLNAFPAGFSVHPRLLRILNRRLETVEAGAGIDWATAESLAFASLLVEGAPVRLSGEDSRRGTFSQRHSVLVDQVDGTSFTPLSHLEEDQAPFAVHDSMLSENAVLGFEYGYALATPGGLTLWEAQFGDFANGAQVIIDQYIASAQAKWQRLNGLVLLLPHGYEGQGAEHSSARLERFLQLCAEDNLQVCNPTTPAQYFHLLRRQVKCTFRKPLIVLAPKSLLRHPAAVSELAELAAGFFQEVLDDPAPVPQPRRVLLCSGKIAYELLEKRAAEPSAVAIVRLEQLYPFPEEGLGRVLAHYRDAGEWFWVQEEPENMGAWHFLRDRLGEVVDHEWVYVGRPAAASPATGHVTLHKAEQAAIVARSFAQ